MVIKKLISKEAKELNKELLLGEVGAILFAPLFSYLMAYLTSKANFISGAAVIGAILGGAIFFLRMRIYHKKKRGVFSPKKLIHDLSYFTPAAFILILILYYPTLFFLSRYLVLTTHYILLSVIASQLIAFSFFLIAINGYRLFLIKYFNKVL